MEIIVVVVLIIGMMLGKWIADLVWKRSFKCWTEEIYSMYSSEIKRLNYEIEKYKGE